MAAGAHRVTDGRDAPGARRALRRLAVAAAVVAAVAMHAAGAPAQGATGTPRGWAIEAATSEVSFDFVLEGKPDGGVFRAFAGEGTFDPARPGEARLSITIESGSVDFGSPVVNAFATSAEGFDSRTHPDIVYRLTALAPTGGDGYLAQGNVTIKGRTEALSTPITLSITDEAARAEGRFEVDRTRFGLGVGPFASLLDLEPIVGVHFVLNARPVR